MSDSRKATIAFPRLSVSRGAGPAHLGGLLESRVHVIVVEDEQFEVFAGRFDEGREADGG